MPIYEYKCSECSHTLELLQKVTAPPPVDCPSCGKPALVKQVTAAGFQLKGSGWYVTDFRDSGASKKDPKKDPEKDGSKDGSKDGATDVNSGAEGGPNVAAAAKDSAVKDSTAGASSAGAGSTPSTGSTPSPGSTSSPSSTPSPAPPATGSGSGTGGTA